MKNFFIVSEGDEHTKTRLLFGLNEILDKKKVFIDKKILMKQTESWSVDLDLWKNYCLGIYSFGCLELNEFVEESLNETIKLIFKNQQNVDPIDLYDRICLALKKNITIFCALTVKKLKSVSPIDAYKLLIEKNSELIIIKQSDYFISNLSLFNHIFLDAFVFFENLRDQYFHKNSYLKFTNKNYDLINEIFVPINIFQKRFYDLWKPSNYSTELSSLFIHELIKQGFVTIHNYDDFKMTWIKREDDRAHFGAMLNVLIESDLIFPYASSVLREYCLNSFHFSFKDLKIFEEEKRQRINRKYEKPFIDILRELHKKRPDIFPSI